MPDSEFERSIKPIFGDTPGSQWLRSILQSHWNENALTKARQVANGVDWEECFGFIRKENIGPLVYSIVKNQEYLPDEFTGKLRQEYDRNHSRNIVFFTEINQILDRLNRQQVPVIVLKGAALSLTVYRDFFVRPLTDLDLLVQQEDMKQTIDLLANLGYEPYGKESQRPGDKFENETLLFKPGPVDFFIEVHWSLLNSPYYQNNLPMEWFWKNSRIVEFEKTPLLILNNEPLALHLSAHLILHHTGREILWLQDIAELLECEKDHIDWESLIDYARNYDLMIPLKLVLEILNKEWNVAIPPQLLERVKGIQPSRAEQQVFIQLTAERRPVAQRFWNDIQHLPGFYARLIFTFENIFPSPAYMKIRYKIRNPLLVPLYYPYRWLLGIRSAL